MRKTCRSCKKDKELSEFNKRAESADGHTPWCKPCIAIRRSKPNNLKGRTFTPDDKKQQVYLAVILRMKESGIASDHTAREMAERVGAL